MNGTVETKQKNDHEKHKRDLIDWLAKKCLGNSLRSGSGSAKRKVFPTWRRWSVQQEAIPSHSAALLRASHQPDIGERSSFGLHHNIMHLPFPDA
jgi:hypothetical protein